MPDSLLIRNARILTLAGVSSPGARRGRDMSNLGVLPRASLLVQNGKVASIAESGPGESSPVRTAGTAPTEIDARGRVLMPGLIDCHTHMCYAGSRVEEWERRLRGETYLDALRSGGGILSTVRAVRDSTVADLARDLGARADRALALGSTTVEVKSGYGLAHEHELKMLDAIKAAGSHTHATLVPTALLGHAMNAEHALGPDGFVNETVDHTLPSISRGFGQSIAIDAFCEKGAWSLEQCLRLFDRALELGHPIRVHADQFNSLGMVAAAIRLGARSIDHLEASTDADLAAVAHSTTIGVALPCTGFHLDGRYARCRPIIDGGGAVAIASNCNPGSAPCLSMPMAIALAVRHCGLTVSEAIVAATANAAAVLGFADRARIAPGARADLILLRDTDERALAYAFGDNPVDTVIVAGRVVREST